MKRPGCDHQEAFCHMAYKAQDGTGKALSIWNSRDGVTPFVIVHKGFDYQHANWSADRFEPDYEPKVGDLIFVDAELEDLVVERLDWVVRYLNDSDFQEAMREAHGWDGERESLPALARELAQHDLTEHGEPPPRLVKVTEDMARGWRAARHNAKRSDQGTLIKQAIPEPSPLGPSGWGHS